MFVSRFAVRTALTLFFAGLFGVFIYFSYIFFQNYYLNDLEKSLQNNISTISGSIKGNIQKQTIIPRILAHDPRIIESFETKQPVLAEVLNGLISENERTQVYTMNTYGVILDSTDSQILGQFLGDITHLDSAKETGFSVRFDQKNNELQTANLVKDPETNEILGAIVIAINLKNYLETWKNLEIGLALTNTNRDILLANRTFFVAPNINILFNLSKPKESADFLLNGIFDLDGQDFYLVETELGLWGWRLLSFVPIKQVQTRISYALALEVFILVFLLMVVLYIFARKEAHASNRLRRESEELRALNERFLGETDQRHRAEEELQSISQTLEQNAKLTTIGQIAATVGHELNQPLTAMRTYLSALRQYLQRGRIQDAALNLTRIEGLLERMSMITRQMRGFARSSEYDIQNFDLRDALLNAFTLMTPQLGNKEITVTRNAPETPVMVSADMMRTEQILINLMRNAVDAVRGQETPQIHMLIRTGNRYASLIISDNGIGFHDPSKLFEPFYTSKPAGEGLGLGLAISASYAKEMSGRLSARHNKPKGAIFELILPLAQPRESR